MTVWAAMSAQGIIGPYFFNLQKDDRGCAVTVNLERCVNMLDSFLVPKLQNFSGSGFPQNMVPGNNKNGIYS